MKNASSTHYKYDDDDDDNVHKDDDDDEERKPLLLPGEERTRYCTSSHDSSIGTSSSRRPSSPISSSPDENENQASARRRRRHRPLQQPLPRFACATAACAALNSCSAGFDIGVNSPAGPLIEQDLHWDDGQLELFMGAINLFALVGALGSAPVIRRAGLRAAFLVGSALFLAGVLLIVTTTTTGTNSSTSNNLRIAMGRVLLGTGVGFGFATTPQYLTEIAPPSHRGFLASWSEIGCNIGIVLGFGTGFCFRGFPVAAAWRLMFLSGCILPCLMIVLTVTFMVESPRWLARRGRLDEARRVLKALAPGNGDGNDNNKRQAAVLDDILADLERERQLHAEAGWSFLWQPTYRRAVLTGLGIAISHMLCGIDAIQYYLTFIMKASGIDSRSAQGQFLVALGGFKLICLFVASALVDRVGRRPLMLWSVAGMLVSLWTLAFHFWLTDDDDDDDGTTEMATTLATYRVMGSLALYLAAFSLGMGPLGWVMPPELFSTTIRSRAVALTTFFNRVTATLMTSTLLSGANLLTWGGYFALLGCVNVIIWILAYFFLPETKGRKLEKSSGIAWGRQGRR